MLRSLGYLGETGRDSVDEIPDLEELRIPRENMAAFFRHNRMLSLIRAKKIPEAAALCREIVGDSPDHKDARLLQVNLALMLGNVEEADQLFEKVIEEFPDPDVLSQAGAYYLRRGRYADANRCFEEVAAGDPGDYEALASLGASHARMGDTAAAREHYEAALAINPRHRRALLELAVLLDRNGEEGGRAYFEKVARLYPFDPDVAFNYGVFLFRSGDEEGGLEQLRRASTMADGDVFEPAHLALASYYEGRGEIETARRYLREVILETQRPEYLRQARSRLERLQASEP
jgi:tetratricopeptide (TPR) repeat protein